MSATTTHDRSSTGPTRRSAPHPAGWSQPADGRRQLQLALAALWLLDGVLQCQPFMFTSAFATRIIAPVAQGNPPAVVHSITWAADTIGRHPGSTNTAFAAIQLLLGIGIAWRPTLRPALAASVAWSLAVWWFGEGLGGLLSGTASPLSGAPGPVILYALLALLLWPTERTGPFEAARSVGTNSARALWLALWIGLACLTLQPANTGAGVMSQLIASMAEGQPDWLRAAAGHGSSLVAHHGLAASITLAAVLTLIAVAVLLPLPAARILIVVAVLTSAVVWIFGQALGGVLGGQATDPGSGPLLTLLALAYWPRSTSPTPVRPSDPGPPATAPGQDYSEARTKR
ncbi:hypothetical protein ABIA33_007009 [Streptacidiphilus sp. MAP12-16]|uniref:hypothetical protein n=1 Tax=Streptacidiphilus sp. MAP12-16 TaxID=3156300 RepID=UPI0035138C94